MLFIRARIRRRLSAGGDRANFYLTKDVSNNGKNQFEFLVVVDLVDSTIFTLKESEGF